MCLMRRFVLFLFMLDTPLIGAEIVGVTFSVTTILIFGFRLEVSSAFFTFSAVGFIGQRIQPGVRTSGFVAVDTVDRYGVALCTHCLDTPV